MNHPIVCRGRPLGIGAAVVAATLAATPAAPAREMLDTEERLLADLKRSTTFPATVPANSEITGLTFAGTVFPGDLIYGGDPAEIAVVPRAISNGLAVNCSDHETRESNGTVSGAFTNTASFTTTHGWEVGGSVQFKAGWPVAETTWTISATYSGSRADTEEESETWSIAQGWSAPVLPRTEFDVQLQVVQQEIEGQAYDLDLELRGPAIIDYRPRLQWVDSTGPVPRNAVIGGHEISPTTNRPRDLPICRAWHVNTTHPGKVVAGRCNISYAGREYEKARFQVLVGDAALFDWEKHEGGSTNDRLGVVAGEERRDDRHGGKLYVCRAEHRGGTHPGKLVINDCMFGYGGREIQQSRYEILTFGGSQARDYRIRIEDHLPLEQRTFRVSGEFRGTKALTSVVVYGASRPASERRCGVAQVAAVDDPRRVEEPMAQAVSVGRAEGGAGTAVRGRAPSGMPGQTPDLLTAATVHSAADLSREPPTRAQLSARLLRLEEPYLFGPDVLAVQKALRRAGWPIAADGFFGPRTDRALRHFQRASDLAPDGIFGQQTQSRLGL